MKPHLAALVIHDLKNALGTLQEQLLVLESQPTRELARTAGKNCADLRSRFVAFLLLYGGEDELYPLISDESPHAFLQTLVGAVQHPPHVTTRLENLKDAPAFWYFDHRLVRLAMDAALHNARRFATSEVRLSAKTEDGFLVLMVDDDGPGLGNGSDQPWATGLGTELCLAVAKAHRNNDREGFVRLANRSDRGVRFELWLP
jgi:signal transduction histidine kinase